MKEFIVYMFYLFIKLIDIALGIIFLLSFVLTIGLSMLHLSDNYIIKQEIFIIMFVISSSSILISSLITNQILKLFSEKTFKENIFKKIKIKKIKNGEKNV